MTDFVLDTNTLIYALNQGLSLTPNRHHLSVISELELLSYHGLSEIDRMQLKKVLGYFNIYELNSDIKALTIELRSQYRLKLPDSIVVATAVYLNKPLITSDKKLLKIDKLTSFELNQVIL
ncbi:type II toxin-antitoxin system VapC family toxin [Moraxella boevrei]|uniref:type II toxin-antitoxin system VapC family toxin n=1 Tax=Faucicola boevrei TaxID=346665 RepID=UPI0037363B7C